MYRDDECAVCGESLPPDHFYCREHAVNVDERLHTIAERLPALRDDTVALSDLVTGIAEETWDYLAEEDPADPEWPPAVDVTVRVDTDQVEVDIDEEPGYVRVRLKLSLVELLEAVHGGLDEATTPSFITACAEASGTSVTH